MLLLKKRLIPLAGLSLLASSFAAQATPIFSINYASTTTEYEDVKRGSGFAGTIGYQFDKVPVFFEGEYYKSGKMDYEFSPGDSVEYSGQKIFAGYALGSDTFIFYLKGGYYSLDAKADYTESGFLGLTSDAHAKESQSGFTLGGGFDWLFVGKQLGLRLEIETPFSVDPAPGIETGEKSQLTSLRVGIVWRPRFGAAP